MCSSDLVSARPGIRPMFEEQSGGGRSGCGSLWIIADDRPGLDGHWVRSFPVRGGETCRFRAFRRSEGVEIPRRSTLVRILWRDAKGKPVRHDRSWAMSFAPGQLPVAEPEYPSDHGPGDGGWTEVSDIYRVDRKSTRLNSSH